MPKQDIERKFLVKSDYWLLFAIPERTRNITQAYLSIEPEIRVRVSSLTPEIGYLSVLSNRVNGVRQVFDY
jgi:CYTH domain-containing protein